MNRATIATLVTAAILGIAGCGSDSDDKADTPKSTPSPTATKAAASTPAAPATTKAALEGPVPKPDAATTAAYIAALDAIDPAITAGKADKAVSRGRDQCASVKETPSDQTKLVSLTEQRFTTTTGAIGATKATQVLTAVRKYICPQY